MTLQYSLNFESIPPGLCQCGCGKQAPIIKHTNRSRGLFKGNPYRFIRGHNSVEKALPRPSTEGVACPPGSMVIALTKGMFAFVDAADYEKISLRTWACFINGRRFYAGTTIEGRRVMMHHLIMGKFPNLTIDHRNRNGLDNRRSNLRIATYTQNAQNSTKAIRNTKSKYKGVAFAKGSIKKWRSEIRVNGKKIYIGWYETEIEAARAYDKAALEHFGEFACVNFPE